MPNHCENHTTFQGSLTDIEAILAIINSTKVPAISNLVPMPAELRDIESRFSDDATLPKWVEEKYANGEMTADEYNERVSEVERLSAAYASNRAKYGYKDWYDWATADENWGTKWGDYDHFGEYPKIEPEYQNLSQLSFSYQTAWGPFSESFWLKVSEQFPNVLIINSYSESGMCFMGAIAVRNGQAFEAHDSDIFDGFPEDGEADDYDQKYMDYIEKLDDRRSELQDICGNALLSYEDNNETRKEGV